MAKSSMFCPNCGTIGAPKTITKGSILIEIVLWLAFLLPGLIYSIWRLSSRYQACPACKAPNMIPANSPLALQATQAKGKAAPAPPPAPVPRLSTGGRINCADDSCTGVLGANGACGTCGRTPEQVRQATAAEWYVFLNERQRGPYTLRELTKAPADALVWRDGMADWVARSEVEIPDAPAGEVTPPTGTGGSGEEASRKDAAGPMGIASMVIGIVALVVGSIPFCGAWAILPALVGLALGIAAMVLHARRGGKRGMAISGIVLNSLAVVIVSILAAAISGSSDPPVAPAEPTANRPPMSEAASRSVDEQEAPEASAGAVIEKLVELAVGAIRESAPEVLAPILSKGARSRWSDEDLARLCAVMGILTNTEGGDDARLSAEQTAIDQLNPGARVSLAIKMDGEFVGALRLTLVSDEDGQSAAGFSFALSDIDLADATGEMVWPVTAKQYQAWLRSSAVDAVSLWKDYNANEVRADDKYKGRSLIISGKVQSIDKDFLDNLVVRLRSPNQFMATHANFAAEERDKVAQLAKGDSVLLNCVVDGLLLGSPVLRNCKLL